MLMLKHKLYNMSDKSITFDEFDNSLNRIAELATILKSFKTKEDSINYLMEETNCSLEECTNAYNFYIKLFAIND